MKIGILTYHSVPNFGANLQALSTVNFLINEGHEPVVINWFPVDLEALYSEGRVPTEQFDCHRKFVEEMLPTSKRCYSEQDVINIMVEENIEGLLVGSDAVFHHVPIKRRKVFSKRKLSFVNLHVTSDRNFPNPFWGTFLSKLEKKIPATVFSASSQNMPYFDVTQNEKKEIAESLSNFNLISVRDTWTKDMISFFRPELNNILITPDPVFGFNNNFLEQISKEEILKKFDLSEDYILVHFNKSFIKDSWIKQLEKIFNSKGYSVIGLPFPEGLRDFGLERNINFPLDTLDWYTLIKYAKGFIGERMHPMIVSIHNSTPFFCFDEYGTYKNQGFLNLKKSFIPESSKIRHVLELGGLLDYMYSYNDDNMVMPEPSQVVEKILTFDLEACDKFREYYGDLYIKSMKRTVQTLVGNNSTVL